MTYKSNNNNSKIIIEEEKNANNNNNNKMATALDFSALSATTASKVNAPNFGAPLTFGMGGNSAHASSGSSSGSKKIYRGAIAAQKSSHSSFMHGQNAVVFPSSTIIKGNVNSNAIAIAMPTMKIKSGLTTAAAVTATEDIGRMSDESFYVPSKVRACTGLQNTPPIFNECNSFLVCDSPQRCMQIIDEVCSDCDFEYEIEINNDAAENFVVTGLVFVHNEPVLFKICVWSEMNGSRIEITRCKGHCLPFSDFMNATQKRLLEKLKGVNIDFGFESEEISDGSDFDFLPMSLDSMESLLLTTDDDNDDSNDNSSSIMNVTYCDSDLELLADDIMGDVFQLETLVAILKCASLKEKVSQNNSLFTAVQNCLNSTDAAVQRTAQKILSLA